MSTHYELSPEEDLEIGKARIAEAARLMPVTTHFVSNLVASVNANELHIGSALYLDHKSAYFLLLLSQAGAQITVLATIETVDEQLICALRDAGITVLANSSYDDVEVVDANSLLACKPDLVLDEGGRIFNKHTTAHETWGITEHLPAGSAALENSLLQSSHSLAVVDLNNINLKKTVDNTVGVGQSSVLAFLDITNLQLGGQRVLVHGYGCAGRGVARFSKALGAKVTVVDPDPVQLLDACFDGYHTAEDSHAASVADVVFLTGYKDTPVSLEWLEQLPNAACVCVVSDGAPQLPMTELEKQYPGETVRHLVTQYQLGAGQRINLIGNGLPIYTVAGQGTPIEVADITFALQAAAIERLVESHQNNETGLISLSDTLERDIAKLKLEHRDAAHRSGELQ